MTARLVFEATLIELSKVLAPALKLYEFNYLFNKAINQYINKVYNVYDLNQQTTDDLRVLKSTAYLTPLKYRGNDSALHNDDAQASSYLSRRHSSIQSLHGATYEVALPIDYLHLLNCVCIYYVAKQKDCYDAGSYIEVPATRLTADSWSTIVTDIYNRPSPMRPYYYIHNQNNLTNNELLPTNPITEVKSIGMPNGTDMTGTYQVVSNGIAITMLTASDPQKFYANIGREWYEIDGLAYNADTLTITEAEEGTPPVKGNPIGKTAEEWEQLEYNKNGTNVTIMYYPSPKLTLGWVDDKKLLNQNAISAEVGQASSNFPRTFKLDMNGDGNPDTNVSLVEKPIGLRAGNTSGVRMEIRYGKDDSLFQLKEVQVDYVKTPQFIRLTQEQIDLSEDTSQIMEFPDYVNQEIINELVHLVMEHANDPRLPNNILMTNTIARPTGQLQQPQAAARG